MKILFLDVDGVLNSNDSFKENHAAWKATGTEIRGPMFSWPLGHLDESAIHHLNRIVEETQCKIVVSSSWRKLCTIEELAAALVMRGFQFRNHIISETPSSNHGVRGREIQTWMDSNTLPIESFVILDDDSDMEHLSPYHVHVDGLHGLQNEIGDEVVRRLNGVEYGE